MKKKITLILLILVALCVGVFVYMKDRRCEVVITQQQIDASLAKRFPLSKKYLLVFDIIYSNPRVTLLEGSDRIQVGLDAMLNIRLNKKPKKLSGGCVITTGLRYNSDTQEFFLDKAQFDRLEIKGIPDEYLDLVTQIASKSAMEFIQSKPVYKLKAKDIKTTTAKLLLKKVEVKDQSVHVTLGL
ncbi:MAG: DUF1439 domain-containing protein [Verrucomicrobiota bacterium]